MTKLYLHIGTEKTGSSYIQSIAAINRNRLSSFGIWFPKAGKRENQLQKGQISAGNAENLTHALNIVSRDKVKVILQRHFNKAREQNCHSILLSNELLVLALSNKEICKLLLESAYEVGFKNIYCLLFLRDPVEQALSLYKHRAKYGTAPEIEEWPQEYYHYGYGLRDFFNTYRESGLELNCRKYKQEEGYLEKVFFSEWLGTEEKMKKPNKAVNQSLTISELLLIKAVNKKNKRLPQFLYEKFSKINKKDKAPDPRITAYYKFKLTEHLAQFTDTWVQCNEILPEGESIKLPQVTQQVEDSEKVATFSEKQLETISTFMNDIGEFQFQLKLYYLIFRRYIGIVKNKVIKI